MLSFFNFASFSLAFFAVLFCSGVFIEILIQFNLKKVILWFRRQSTAVLTSLLVGEFLVLIVLMCMSFWATVLFGLIWWTAEWLLYKVRPEIYDSEPDEEVYNSFIRPFTHALTK